ncbi:MAG: HlyD family secretion protein [Acidobacteriota bacterium]
MKRKRGPVILVVLALLLAGYYVLRARPADLVLTGIVTTNDVIVSPQVEGQVSKLLVAEGDSVASNQLLAVLGPAELQADRAYYEQSAEAMTAQTSAARADLAAAEASDSEAIATLANARATFGRVQSLQAAGGASAQEGDSARTALAVAQARADAAARQVAAKRSALVAAQQQQRAAAAQTSKADVRLGYSEIRAPIAGIVDVRAALVGEVVTPGQPIVTLINPDDLWVRADVEETYIDRIRLGDSLTVRFPSGTVRRGVVYYRGVDAGFATQRDVSRTKRDIKTFEIRLRVDNHDRRMAVGMTATVLLPLNSAAGT